MQDAATDPAPGPGGATPADAWRRLTLRRLYVLNLAVLAAHEVDSAYWHEWELFRLPGGSQLFVALNLALFAVFLHGLVRLVEGRRSGLWYSLALAAAGLFAAVLHSTFLALGHPEFTAPVSLALLAATTVLSLAQARITRSALRHEGHG